MSEPVDDGALKAPVPRGTCGFESHPGHLLIVSSNGGRAAAERRPPPPAQDANVIVPESRTVARSPVPFTVPLKVPLAPAKTPVPPTITSVNVAL